MLGRARGGVERREALVRLTEWTRQRFSLAEDEVVLVTELACTLPGCPPLETVVAFWTADQTRHHLKIFKPAAQIVLEDFPPGWMKDALAVPEGFECGCC